MNNTPTADNDSAFVLSLTQERRLELPDKKEHYLDTLLRSLDALIFIQFAVAYILDNLSILLILRTANQVVHIQYRPPAPPQLPPTILVSVVCVVTHLFQSRQAGKRLYGGLMIDFVGELAPSRSRLLILDMVIFCLQLLMLVVGFERLRASGDVQALEQSQPQDLDSEEAGRLRSRPGDQHEETEEGIEMQSLLPDGSGENGSAHQKSSEQIPQEDEVILLDMRKGLKALMRRPPPPASPPAAGDSPAARVSLATFLARVAAARARGG